MVGTEEERARGVGSGDQRSEQDKRVRNKNQPCGQEREERGEYDSVGVALV